MAAPDQTPENDLYWKIARVTHESVRAWQQCNGEETSPPWDLAPAWMRDAMHEAVVWRARNPDAPPSIQHDQWMAQKQADGWIWGARKSDSHKTHPMMVSYDQLPESERRKDALVGAVIDALAKQVA